MEKLAIISFGCISVSILGQYVTYPPRILGSESSLFPISHSYVIWMHQMMKMDPDGSTVGLVLMSAWLTSVNICRMRSVLLLKEPLMSVVLQPIRDARMMSEVPVKPDGRLR